MQNLQYSRDANRFWGWGVGGPEGHKHNPQLCDNMLLYYPIIMLDLLYVVYAEITYNQRGKVREPTGRGRGRAVNC